MKRFANIRNKAKILIEFDLFKTTKTDAVYFKVNNLKFK